MPPPQLRLIGTDGAPLFVNTTPAVGQNSAAESLPVVLAQGVILTQSFVNIPVLTKTSNDAFLASVKQVVGINTSRRYLKIINNGNYDVEIWNGVIPSQNQTGQTLPQGEVLFSGGFGIIETDTCRTSAVYATCLSGATGLLILEG